MGFKSPYGPYHRALELGHDQFMALAASKGYSIATAEKAFRAAHSWFLAEQKKTTCDHCREEAKHFAIKTDESKYELIHRSCDQHRNLYKPGEFVFLSGEELQVLEIMTA